MIWDLMVNSNSCYITWPCVGDWSRQSVERTLDVHVCPRPTLSVTGCRRSRAGRRFRQSPHSGPRQHAGKQCPHWHALAGWAVVANEVVLQPTHVTAVCGPRSGVVQRIHCFSIQTALVRAKYFSTLLTESSGWVCLRWWSQELDSIGRVQWRWWQNCLLVVTTYFTNCCNVLHLRIVQFFNGHSLIFGLTRALVCNLIFVLSKITRKHVPC